MTVFSGHVETVWHSCSNIAYSQQACVVPCTHNMYGDKSVTAAGPNVWNSLPLYLQQDVIYGHFKWKLKTFLLKIGDNWLQHFVTVGCFVYALEIFVLFTYKSFGTLQLLLLKYSINSKWNVYKYIYK